MSLKTIAKPSTKTWFFRVLCGSPQDVVSSRCPFYLAFFRWLGKYVQSAAVEIDHCFIMVTVAKAVCGALYFLNFVVKAFDDSIGDMMMHNT